MKFSLITSFIISSALAVSAAPFAESSSQVGSTLDGSLNLPFAFPPENYKTSKLPNFATTLSNPESEEENIKAGLAFLAKELFVKPEEIKITDAYTDQGKVIHVYVVRNVAGAEVVNQRAAVHMRKGAVVAFSSSFENNKSSFVATPMTAPVDVMPQTEAIKKGSAAVNGLPINKDVPVHFEWVANAKGEMIYTYVAQYRNAEGSQWYELFIDAKTGSIVHSVDFVSRASYKVLPFPKYSPEDGFEVQSNPAFEASSPLGWHNDGSKTYTTTRGNNIDVTLPNNVRPESTGDLDFDTAWDASAEPRTDANSRAAAVNLFFLANKMHDISLQYGFTESAGNFQNKNREGFSGVGGDPVQVSAQSKQGTNNAYFSTPADGQKPSMVMFLFTQTKPQRDGSLENDVPIHEYTHGISTRMTGGGRSASCLRGRESGSMGEGWGDSLANFLLRKPTDTRDVDFVMGSYVIAKSKGIRSYPYSTNMQTNPLTYADLKSRSEVHAGGEVWATVLNELYWNLVDKWGYSANWYDATQKQGNIVAMRLVFGGFANQPCNPTFVQARDAILLSDKLYYNNEHTCEIWKAFAKRGMGIKAVSGTYTNSFDVPAECQGSLSRRASF